MVKDSNPGPKLPAKQLAILGKTYQESLERVKMLCLLACSLVGTSPKWNVPVPVTPVS